MAADARLLHCEGLEVDESALTGESVPVRKVASRGTDASRIVLAGTDVTVGTARAVAVAVGQDTRMGALAAALAHEANGQTPLGQRLSLMLHQGIPIIAASGALITVSGLLWGRPLLPQLALGASAAIAALPKACRCWPAPPKPRSRVAWLPATFSSGACRRSKRSAGSTSLAAIRRAR